MAAIPPTSALPAGALPELAALPEKAAVGSWHARWMNEGAGARVKRTIGAAGMPSLIDPFLLLDEFFVDKESGAGFPDHPHRGFQTVTLMVSGAFKHTDNHGHTGVIGAGDCQYMTAGRGVVHSEFPEAPGVSHGMQLWVNLKAKDKLTAPNYQDLLNKDIPVAQPEPGVAVRVIAGVDAFGTRARTHTLQPVHFLEVRLAAGKRLVQRVPAGWNSFAYVLEGSVAFGSAAAPSPAATLVQFVRAPRDELVGMAAHEDAHLVFLAGEPTDEPVSRAGPFVMTTPAEIEQAFADYRAGRFARDVPAVM